MIAARANHEIATAAGRPGAPQNVWVAAAEFLAAFQHLRAPDGYQLACFCEPASDERQSRMVWVRATSTELPPIPAPLQQLEFGFSFNGPSATRPPDLPDWISWDVMPLILDDGAPEALFEKSIFGRWIDQLLNFGHEVYWPRHRVLRGSVESDQDLSRINGPSLRDRSFDPVIECFASSDQSIERLPVGESGRSALAGQERCLVRFYTHSAYVQETVQQLDDWYVASRLLYSESRTIARGSNSYLV